MSEGRLEPSPIFVGHLKGLLLSMALLLAQDMETALVCMEQKPFDGLKATKHAKYIHGHTQDAFQNNSASSALCVQNRVNA